MKFFATPTYQANIKNFVINHLSHENMEEHRKTHGTEIRVFCPFCDGGPSHEFSFDVNVTKGVARCWRAKCGWRGTTHRLYSEVMQTSLHEAFDFLSGGTGMEVMLADLEAFDKLWLSSLWRIDEIDYIEFNETVYNSIPIEEDESDTAEAVKEWIRDVRGYNIDNFLRHHELMIPPQIGKWEGYVIFVVRTGDNKTYQGYKFRSDLLGLTKRPETNFSIPKTMAPKNNTIKRVLYNYNNLKPSAPVFVCEGIFDAARMMQRGFNAVCSFSTEVSEIQCYYLSQLPNQEIIICFDYGTKDISEKMAKRIQSYSKNKDVSYLEIHERDTDPDSVSKEELFRAIAKRTKLKNNSKTSVLDGFSKMFPD